MIIKRLKLQNIRSYKEAAIDIPLGKTLFEGDIGSGKSSLLMAIEFALFGLGSETGGSLLRSGASEGSVGLTFEVDGSEYDVLRTLIRKGERVQQREGILTAPERTLHLSPSELKERILGILGFNEPTDPKALSIIYRYAVYTPQEEMKAILFLRPDLRLQTLRKAFRVEDYKIAKENASELSRALMLKAREFHGMAVDIQSIEMRIANDKAELESQGRELVKLESGERERVALLQSLVAERERLRVDETRLSVAQSEVEQLERFLESNEKDVRELRKESGSLEKRTAQLSARIKEIESIQNPSPKGQEELTQDIMKLERHVEDLKTINARMEGKIDDYRLVQMTGSCPTCDRKANPAEFVQKIDSKMSEKKELSKKLKEHASSLENFELLLEKKQQYDSSRERLREYKEELSRYNDELSGKEAKVNELVNRYEDSKRKLGESRRKVESLKGVSSKIRELDAKIEAADEELRKVRNERAVIGAGFRSLKDQIGEREDELKRKREFVKRSETLGEHRIWIEDYFMSTLDAIERHVLVNMNQEFNSNFQSWFASLVEDPGKDARVDENFTPIVQQDGYEQDIYYLSGGEKTSLALAYRLALNNVVKKVSTGMKTNLIIFDEPTDGFSKEQLGRVREILDELESPQIIVVSHEKELESFADQIFKIFKVNGESKVISGS